MNIVCMFLGLVVGIAVGISLEQSKKEDKEFEAFKKALHEQGMKERGDKCSE